MNKILKYSLISLGSLLGIVLIASLSMYIYFLVVSSNTGSDTSDANTTPVVDVTQQELNEINEIIYYSIPNEPTEDIQFKYSLDEYPEYEVTYFSSNTDIISNAGRVHFSEDSHIVRIKYTISSEKASLSDYKDVKVLKLSGSKAIDAISKSIRNILSDGLENGSALPVKVDQFTRAEIEWRTSVIQVSNYEPYDQIRIEYKDDIPYIYMDSEEHVDCFISADISFDGYNQLTLFVI